MKNINEALELLKQYKIVVSNRTYFVLKGTKIYVNSENSSFLLTIEDFLNLYKDNIFFEYEDSDVSIDTDRDDEYYNNFKHK